MLVLTRRPTQTIRIADRGVTITVIDIRQGRVRIGIEAPRDVRVIREELLHPVSAPADAARVAQP